MSDPPQNSGKCGARIPAGGSGFTEDSVQLGATDRADALGHTSALVTDVDLSSRLALFLALDAVELATPCFRHCGLLADVVLVTFSVRVEGLFHAQLSVKAFGASQPLKLQVHARDDGG